MNSPRLLKSVNCAKIVVAACMVGVAGGCATAHPRGVSPSADLSPNADGPTILYVHSDPDTVELNRDFQPIRPAEVLADIQDPIAKISNVVLQFTGIPLEVPMENIGGTTWRAQLTPRQLEMLAVSGQTIRYEAKVIARDQEGKIGSSKISAAVAIKTPDLASTGSG